MADRDPERARELVMQYGWNATAFQILNPGIDHWFSQATQAVVGYTRRENYLLVAGAPVCRLDDLQVVVNEFEAAALALKCRVCYVCAAGRLHELLGSSPGYSVINMGAEPVWDPHHWPAIVDRHRSLRAQLRRAVNKGVTIEQIDPARGREDPQLQQTLIEWTRSRCLPPLHFLTEPETLQGEVSGRVLLVARRNNAIIAFLVASPVVARNGYLVEQIARTPSAPNGASELLIDFAMRLFLKEDRQYVTLGLVALSQKAGVEQRNPVWLRVMMSFARSHANRFYNFQGLERFRSKMEPDAWEPIYAISNERHFSPFALYAIGEAFSGIAPWRAIGIGVANGIRAELAMWKASRRPTL